MSVMLDTPPKQLLADFPHLLTCAGIERADQIRRDAEVFVRFLHGDKEARANGYNVRRLQQAWYDSLLAGEPDYGVYDDDDYLAEAWACWAVYSRGYLRTVRSQGIPIAHHNARLIVDLGCGIGLTTRALRELWPRAEVIGTNLPDTKQYRVAEIVSQEEAWFRMRPDTRGLGHADVVFASEIFEHFPKPLEHLRDILEDLTPTALIVANTFGAESVGHFPTYDMDGKHLRGAAASRAFAAELRAQGYEHVPIKAWNNRPAYWRLAS